MNKKTEFEIEQCKLRLEKCQEMLMAFSVYLNQSVGCLEESIFATRHNYLAEFNDILESYQKLIDSNRQIKKDLENLTLDVSKVGKKAADICQF